MGDLGKLIAAKVQKLTRSGHTEWDCIGTLHVEMLIRTKVRRGGVKMTAKIVNATELIGQSETFLETLNGLIDV